MIAETGSASKDAATELRALLDAALDAIVIIDTEGRIVEFNAAAQRLFGYSLDSVRGEPVHLLMPEPHRSRHQGYIRRYLRTGEARIIGIGREVEARKADGTLFPAALSVGEASGPHGPRFIAILRDLSAQRAAETEARVLRNRLAHVGRFSLMGEMVAGLAHELNQPLGAVATYAEAGKRLLERVPPDVAGILTVCDKISAQAHRASEVLGGLRDFIRKQDSVQHLLEVKALIEETLGLIVADARAEGIAVTVECAPDLPPIRGDRIQLQQVLLNLTRNAVDAMKNGLGKKDGLLIRAETETRAGGTKVVVTVTDHGPGVPDKLVQDIFHPFFSTKPDGLGVGLAISKTIIRAHAGELFYRPNPSGGAVFGFALPAYES
jgi:two-component system, LuxR family, sensor kinase FixL